MQKVIELKTLEDFMSVKEGDFISCEFHRDIHDYPKKSFRHGVFKVFANIHRTKEIVLQKKNNIYFNYGMFINPSDGQSNLKSAILILHEPD